MGKGWITEEQHEGIWGEGDGSVLCSIKMEVIKRYHLLKIKIQKHLLKIKIQKSKLYLNKSEKSKMAERHLKIAKFSSVLNVHGSSFSTSINVSFLSEIWRIKGNIYSVLV